MAKRKSKKSKRPKLGSGKRFGALVSVFRKRGMSPKKAAALAASIGRKKFGKKRFKKLSAAGKRKAARKRK